MLTNEGNTCPTFDDKDIGRYEKKARDLRSEVWTTLSARVVEGLARVIRLGAALTTDTARSAAKSIERERKRSAFIIALQALSDRKLKDIGLHRSEIQSAVSELLDGAPPTRVRGPARAARTRTIEDTGAAANDERFVERVSGHR